MRRLVPVYHCTDSQRLRVDSRHLWFDNTTPTTSRERRLGEKEKEVQRQVNGRTRGTYFVVDSREGWRSRSNKKREREKKEKSVTLRIDKWTNREEWSHIRGTLVLDTQKRWRYKGHGSSHILWLLHELFINNSLTCVHTHCIFLETLFRDWVEKVDKAKIKWPRTRGQYDFIGD